MGKKHLSSKELIAVAESFEGIRAGIAEVEAVVNMPSYKEKIGDEWRATYPDDPVQWIKEARYVLILAMWHPEDKPWLDWFYRGNTEGNRRLFEISKLLEQWLRNNKDLDAQPLPYHVERGGVFLKDAAVLAGLGVIGKNNLLVHPQWGPRIRLRAVLFEGTLSPSEPLKDFYPCETCKMYCRKACPKDSFRKDRYNRLICIEQLNSNRTESVPGDEVDPHGNPILVTKWCRGCEFACPIGK